MNPSDIIALLSLGVSAISVIASIFAFIRSGKYRQLQQKLAQLELIRLTQKANVLVLFTAQHTIRYEYRMQYNPMTADSYRVPTPESKDTYYLVIKNIGNVEARIGSAGIRRVWVTRPS